MLQALLALALALSSPQTSASNPAAGIRFEPWRALTVPSLARVLPCETTRDHALLRDAEGEARALVSRCAIVGPVRTVLEREVLFAEGGLRLLLTEEITGDRRRLVWRELRSNGARTWVAEWGPGGARVTGYGWRRPVHEELAGFDPASARRIAGPLELERGLEGGRFGAGDALWVVDPTAGRVTRVTIGAIQGGLAARRDDGTLLLAVEGGTVRFHDGVAAALPIPGDAAARHRQRWMVESRPAHEVVLARIRAAR